MKRLLVFLYTQILGNKIYDEFNDVLGELKDIYVTTDDGYPRVIGYKVKREGVTFHYEFKNINFYEDKNRVKIKTTGSREILPRTYSYLLSEHLLDRKIVDINGKKVVRVNDLRIAELAGEYRVVAVETGPAAMFRRMGTPKLGKFIYKAIKKDYEDKVLMWDDVESVEMVNNNLQLSVPYKKLSTLHPADLADILEELDDKSRKQVFESLDEDLAADTFEEIEDEYRGSIIKDLSVTKTAELLENMDNDEIVDLLDDLEEEERDKVLFNLEKEDAEEVEELLKYEDETVGSIMSKDFISFGLNLTVEETIEILKEMKPDEDVLYYIYVTDEEDKIEGLVTLRDLILSEGSLKLKDVMEENITTVKYDEPIGEAIEQAAKYDLLLTPVVDDNNKIIGIIQLHDLVDETLYPLWKKKNRKSNNN
ncbi:CBS domain-containing protein [Clostridium sp. SHJSY1]|uniref:magnesium transporter MgtE N-terminal domain-containing protein n=1 Tax=Clostridium sp. SHJSY1 TaxID=2942483 RepID=UPI002875D77C|nr:CBS domain-containing protein [Clostridium sp. SHJSY1]MDS0526870.1 CBS domain-containing protein [Clostridium sp. SHJSY1]